MKKVLLLLTIAMFAFCSVSFAQSAAKVKKQQKAFNKMMLKLELDDVQKVQAEKMMQEVRTNYKGKKRVEFERKLVEILDEEQMELYSKMVAKRKDRANKPKNTK